MLFIIMRFVDFILSVLFWLIIIDAVLSFFPAAQNNKFYFFVRKMVEPFLSPIRKLLNKFEFSKNIPLDFSPFIALILIQFLRWIV